jgi:hypothetical protein
MSRADLPDPEEILNRLLSRRESTAAGSPQARKLDAVMGVMRGTPPQQVATQSGNEPTKRSALVCGSNRVGRADWFLPSLGLNHLG